jgi:hypothetical protein
VAHEKDVVHRDLKPENIAVLPDGSLKLFDFGIARAGPSSVTGSVRIGTPSYMSPEQHRGDPVDAKSDVFSLACLFYELLTAKTPFDLAGDLYAGRYKPLPASIATRIGSAAELLTRMLSIDPAVRPTADGAAHVLASVRRAVDAQGSLDRSAYADAVTRMLESIPGEDAEPVLLSILGAGSGFHGENMALAVLQMPLTFGALQCSYDDATGGMLVRAKSEVARLFLASLAIYVRYGLNLIERWERRSDPSESDALCLLGPDFLEAMERRRVFQHGLPQPIRIEYPGQIVIKAWSATRKTSVYLMQYDRFAQQYQFLGGKRRGHETAIEAMDRAMRTKLPANALVRDVDYELQPVREEVVTRGLSRTVGAFTEYHFSIFSIVFTRPLVLGEDDRWVTEGEMFSGRLAEASAKRWSRLARVVNLLEKGLAEIPFSFSEPVE